MAPFWRLAVATAIALVVTTNAHMNLFYPPPLGGENNPHRTDPPEPRIDYPYNCCGEEVTPFPCRGYLKHLGTDQGRPVATWEAGSVQNFSLVGKGTHWGGSCQAGFSIDEGKTWQVVKSYEGACPHRDFGPQDPENQSFKFTVPADIPAGDHIFGWTWINREREFFMNCAVVTIVNGTEDIPEPEGNATNHEPSNPGNSHPVSQPVSTPASQRPATTLQPSSLPTGSPDLQLPKLTYVRPEPQDPTPTYAPSAAPNHTTKSTPYDSGAIFTIPAEILSIINNAKPRPTTTTKDACKPPSLSNPPVARIPINHRRPVANSHERHTKRAPEVPYHERPGFLIANLGNGCETARTMSEVKYPNPGPDVAEGDGMYPLELPGPAEDCGY